MAEQARRDVQDAAPTLPQQGWDGAATVPAAGAARNLSDTITTIAPEAAATVLTHRAPAPAQGEAATMHTALADAATLAPGTAQPANTANSFSPQTGAGLTRGGTGTFSRALRTKVNQHLPAESQVLDRKLQTSRVSVFADMAMTAKHVIPPGLRKLVEIQATEGRYHVDKALAAGGMGAVLKITDNDFARGAAMKVIHGQFAKNPEAMERFLAEAQVTAQLEHPNIVPIHDLGIMEDGTLYFTMKLIDGESLGKVIKLLRDKDERSLKRWTLDEKLMVFLKVLEGVGFANEHQVIHRDLKPDNIMIGAHGEVLVVDWGIAKVLGKPENVSADAEAKRKVETLRNEASLSNTMEGSAMGTIYYMPPEQAAGQLNRIAAWSDVYALGATLYELVTLKRPLETTDLKAMLAKAISGTTVPIRTSWPEIPDDLAAVITKSMHATPEFRYATCVEFADDLRRFLAGQAVAARQRNLVERLGAWYGAHKLPVNLGACAAVLLIAATVTTVKVMADKAKTAAAGKREAAVAAMKSGDAAGLRQAQELLAAALALNAEDPRTAELQGQVKQAIGAAEQREKADIERQAAVTRAATLLAEAMTVRDAGDLAKAKTLVDSAQQLDPTNAGIAAVRDALIAKLADTLRANQDARARQAKADGDAALAKAKALPVSDNAVDALLSSAEASFALSGKDGAAAPGIQESVAALAQLRRDVVQARSDATAVRDGEALLGEAKAALERKDLATARDRAAAASDRLRGRLDAAQLLAAVLAQERDAQAAAERSAALAASVTQAKQQLATAESERERIVATRRELDDARSEAAALEPKLAGQDAKARAPLLAIQAKAQTARQQIAEHWQLAEAAAQSVISALQDERSAEPVRSARAILAELYHGRLVEARAGGQLSEIAAFSNLLSRYDDGRFQADRSRETHLALSGPAGLAVTLQPVSAGADTRLIAQGETRTVTLPALDLTMPAGRWRLTQGDQAFDLLLAPGPVALTWPAPFTLKALPAGLTLRLVPAAKPFLLSATEITVEQYATYLDDPAVIKALVKGYDAYLAQRDGGAADVLLPAGLPRLTLSGPETWLPRLDGERVVGFEPPKTLRGTPVTGISRADAEAYCGWLGKRLGRTVRLPTASEWRFAADGGDPQRTFPWGDTFDLSFTASAYDTPVGNATPTIAGSKSGDCGPFGHHDLAGNVHEWLADRSGRIGGLVAGGSVGCDQPGDFALSRTTSADPAGVYPVIGFRILVEHP